VIKAYFDKKVRLGQQHTQLTSLEKFDARAQVLQPPGAAQ